MDLWSVIPIEVHHCTILSTMVSFIPLGNILWKDTTCKHLLENESYLMISFHHSILQLAYTTQAWILKFKTCAMQTNIWNAHSNAPYKFMSLLPPTCVLKNLIDPFPLSYFSPYVKFSPYHLYFYFFPLCVVFSLSLCTISPPLSSMTTKVQNVDKLRLSMSINGMRIIFPNLIQFKILVKDI